MVQFLFIQAKGLDENRKKSKKNYMIRIYENDAAISL